MNKGKELKWGVMLSYAQMVLHILIGVIYTPIMIRLLGQSEYGLYNTVASTIAMLSILNLGFSSGYVRYYARYRQAGEQENIYRLNGLFMIIFSIIGVVALVCGLFLTNHLNIVFKDGLTANEYGTAKILMLLMTINMALSFPMSVLGTIINANERFVFLKLIDMINTVVGPMVNLPLLLMGYRSIVLVVSSLVFSLITAGINGYYVIKRLGNKFRFDGIDRDLFNNLLTYTAFIAINLIVDQINTSIDKVLLGRYKGTSVVAVYAVGMTIYTYYMTISTSVSGVFTPRIHRIYNENPDKTHRNRELTELLIRVGRIQFLILMLICSGFIIFGRSFIRFWAGDGYQDSYFVALILMIPASVPLIQNLGIEIQRAANKHQFRSLVYLSMAICNLILTIYLCQIYGAIGAATGTGLSLLLANGIIMNIYYHKKIGLNMLLFWHHILRSFLGMVPAFIVGFILYTNVSIQSVLSMLALIMLYIVAYSLSVWFFSMNEYEKDLVRAVIRKATHVGNG